ncbi:MAG: MBL fold metallo-hydrolase, partial [Lachnospiraceae bacterium]|nr:MBL fold metallo-hydrolase [Lachnospiraceae bacterium]
MIFKIKNLSDNQADCFIIILEHKDRKISILVDGNREGMKSCQMLHEEISKLEQLDYIVVSHIDNDHLGGILKYLESGIGKEKLSQTKIIYN